jgi:hypothetical protein
MKIISTLTFIIIIGIFIILCSALINSNHAESLCREYETQKVIPNGSCYCTAKLFTNWAESYDWKDACAIWEASKTYETK